MKYRPFFTGLSGAEMGTEPVNASLGPSDGGGGGGGGGGEGGAALSEEAKAGITYASDGKVVLRAKTALQLMKHITKTILENDEALFTEQVLSESTRQELSTDGKAPGEAFARLQARRRDIGKLFKAMPMGEHTPFVVMERVGSKVYRVEVTGKAAEELEYRGFEMELEKSLYKLRWFF